MNEQQLKDLIDEFKARNEGQKIMYNDTLDSYWHGKASEAQFIVDKLTDILNGD
jgi:hypothetical protein